MGAYTVPQITGPGGMRSGAQARGPGRHGKNEEVDLLCDVR